ncbi:hypothetical protein CspHIS471_0511830 [Cutaneotrichosporon sp. HIS471]|nr:hypothetical protein CspHIS471_0511830 [Cutaneotrichosporon sp. HIS471]
MTTDRRPRSERIPSATYSIHSRRRDPSAISVPAGSGFGGTRLVARIQALFNPQEPDQFSSSYSTTRHPRRSRLFTNMSRRSCAVNVPGSSRTDSPVVVVDAATLGNVNPGDGPTITLTADQLLRVNVPTGEPPKSGSKPATPTLSRSTSRVYQVNAADLANVNQTQA